MPVEVRGPGQGQPRLADPLGRDDAAPIGWVEAADLIISSLGAAISDKQVTYDLARLMDGAHEISTSAFGQAMIERM